MAALVITCTPEPEIIKLPVEPPEVAEKKNPYSVEIFTKAFQNVAARAGGRIKAEPPPATHRYVRFEPHNLDQIMQLQELGYDLWEEPLDQHIEYEGNTYRPPGLPDSLNHYYTLIPVNYPVIEDVPGNLLSQVVLFDEDAGDERDPEEDPWIPNPDNCPDPNNPNCPCYEGPCARRTADGQVVDLREDLVKKTTKYLLDAGVNLIELYNEMMKLAGYEDEVIPTDGAGRTQGQRYYPAGCIQVQDNSINQNVPVKFAFVKSRRFIKLDKTYTNVNGCFNISKGYRNKVQIIVKFKNEWAKIRGVNQALDPTEWTHAVKVKLGLFEKTAMQNIHHVFRYSPNAESRAAMEFTAAHVINTVYDINQYCIANSINTIPNNLSIWVTTSNVFRSSTAPMLNKVSNQTLAGNLLAAIPVVGKVYKIMTTLKYAPDVAITINNDSRSGPAKTAVEVIGTSFHELGHAVHYNQVGGNYWVDVIAQYISNYVNTGTAYGNKNNLTAVVESWGYFIGHRFTADKYQTTAASLISNPLRNQLEHQTPSNDVAVQFPTATTSRGWIPFGLPHDLIDTGEPVATGVIDNVSNYTISQIFRGYSSSATTVQNLRLQILNTNNQNQAAQVNQLVTSYNW